MADTAVGAALTDGTGVSKLTVPKIVKDFIADALIGAAAGLATANIAALPQDTATLTVAGWAIANAIGHSLYRFILKWATS